MSLPASCDACKARVEWHVTASGARMPIDPDPHADGAFFFGPGLKLVRQGGNAKPRPGQKTYRCHWDTCAKGNEASKRGLHAPAQARGDRCEKWDCTREDRHSHCFKCGETDHFAPECES